MKVLVTGATGRVGANLVRSLVEQGYEVRCSVLEDDPKASKLEKFDVEVLRGSLLEKGHLKEAVLGVDAVYHLGGLLPGGNEPDAIFDVNVVGTYNLFEALRIHNPEIERFIFASSDDPYDVENAKYQPIDENHPEFPRDIYSANKTASEKYVLVYGHAYGMNATVVRLPNVFGPRAWIRTPDFGFVNYFIGLALQGKELTVFGDGAQRRNVVYVDDCVSALVLAAQSEKSNGEVLFAVGDRQHTVAEVAESISENIGGVVKYIEWPPDRKSIEIGDAVISNKKLRSSLNWVPQTDLEEGLIRTREYFTPCLEKYL